MAESVDKSGLKRINRSRVVDVSEEVLNNFICGICLSIFSQPLATPCCAQAFCRQCVVNSLSEQNSCPNALCGKGIRSDKDLIPIPKQLENLLNILKIKCNYSEQGCSQVMKIVDLDHHLDVCDFRPNKPCDTCGLTRGYNLDHDCLKSLKIALESSDKLNQQLQTELASSIKILDILKTEKQNSNIIQKDSLKNKIIGLFKSELTRQGKLKSSYSWPGVRQVGICTVCECTMNQQYFSQVHSCVESLIEKLMAVYQEQIQHFDKNTQQKPSTISYRDEIFLNYRKILDSFITLLELND